MNTLSQEQLDYVMNLTAMLAKGKVFNVAAVHNCSYYLITDGGLLYSMDISNIVNDYNVFLFIDAEGNIMMPDRIPAMLYNSYQNILCDVMSINRGAVSTIFHNPDIMEDENFKFILESKTSEGAFRYYFPTDKGNMFIYLTKGMLGLNKADTCSFKVYEYYGVNNYYLAEFEIHKKKMKTTIKLTFRFLQMYREETANKWKMCIA